MKFKLLSILLLFSSFSTTLADKPPQIPDFPIYVDANKTSKIVEKGTLSTPLIKIFRQKDWLKVADTSNGAVGWVHEEDYKKALETWNKPKTESILINIQEKAHENPRKIEVIAYKNGKKLDEKEAQNLYNLLKKQQEERDRAMRKWFNSMNELFNKMHNEAFMGSSFLYSLPVIAPMEKSVEESKK